jgi:hypothetical protein
MTTPEPAIGGILRTEEQIHDHLAELAADIDGDYTGPRPGL